MGVGGPGCGDGPKLAGRPLSGLFVTKRSGFGGGRNVGGNGGARELIVLSVGAIGRDHSAVLL